MKILKIAGMFLLALLIMVVTQGIASIFSDLIPFLGMGAILQGILYIIFAFLVVRLFIKHVLKDQRTHIASRNLNLVSSMLY